MNVELVVTNCDSNHTSELCSDDYGQLRPRTNTEPGYDIMCPPCATRGPYTPSRVTRAPLISRDPQTSSLDRYTPNCYTFFHSSRLEQKHSPFFCKLKKKKKSKSAQCSPAHSTINPLMTCAEVQDLGCYNGHDPIESNLDFGFRGESPYSWAGSNESFSDLDRGMTRDRLVPPNQFIDRPMSRSSSGYSLTTNELSSCHSSESIPQQLVSPNRGLITAMCSSALRKSCENILNLTATKKHKSLSCRNNIRSKSSGGMIIQKFSKKLSKLSLTKGSEGGSGGGSKKKKRRANSASRLEGAERYVTHLM